MTATPTASSREAVRRRIKLSFHPIMPNQRRSAFLLDPEFDLPDGFSVAVRSSRGMTLPSWSSRTADCISIGPSHAIAVIKLSRPPQHVADRYRSFHESVTTALDPPLSLVTLRASCFVTSSVIIPNARPSIPQSVRLPAASRLCISARWRRSLITFCFMSADTISSRNTRESISQTESWTEQKKARRDPECRNRVINHSPLTLRD